MLGLEFSPLLRVCQCTRGLTINTDIINSISVPGGIVDYLQSGNFDLVVLGNRGKPGISQVIGEALPPWFTFLHGQVLRMLLDGEVDPDQLARAP